MQIFEDQLDSTFEVTNIFIEAYYNIPLPQESLLATAPLFWRFIPGFTSFEGKGNLAKYGRLTFAGYTIDSKIALTTQNNDTLLLPGYNPQHLGIIEDTYPPGVCFSSLSEKMQRAHLQSNGIFFPVTAPEVCSIYSRVMAQIQQLTIRGRNLYEVLMEISVHKGLQYSVAVTGGAIRDAILEVEPTDIDLVIGMPYNELKKLLIEKFGLQGESLSDSTLRCTGKSKEFGQLKVMSTQVFVTLLFFLFICDISFVE